MEIINVGGLKVYPEEVEAVINRHPNVHMSRVRSQKNPITGAIVVADVVLTGALPDEAKLPRKSEIEAEILRLCHERLASHKIPVFVFFVPNLPVAQTGKLQRAHA